MLNECGVVACAACNLFCRPVDVDKVMDWMSQSLIDVQLPSTLTEKMTDTWQIMHNVSHKLCHSLSDVQAPINT